MQDHAINRTHKTQPKQLHNEPPKAQMIALHEAGFNILPVGRADDPKAASMAWDKPRLNVNQSIAIAKKNKSGAYGIRLDDVVVVDHDEWDTDKFEHVSARFGLPEVTVTTGRGLHCYYKKPKGWDYEGAAEVLKSAGIKADLKHGERQYVIGPHSCRWDGVSYYPMKGELASSSLSKIIPANDLTRVQRDGINRIHAGQRHNALKGVAYETVWGCETRDELTDNLVMWADLNLSEPVPEREITNMVDWYWGKFERGELVSKEHPSTIIRNAIMDIIGNYGDARLLYLMLKMNHGNTGRAFLLDRDAMVRGGIIDLSRDGFVAARQHLEDVGLLEVAVRHKKGSHKRQYRLTDGPKGKGVGLYIDIDNGIPSTSYPVNASAVFH